uniref:Uncharacterized protein n=1 Tax=Ciona savignyi TaxID=51511 RepID=H2ZHU7_CIOSA
MKTQTLLAILFMCLLVVDFSDGYCYYYRRRRFYRRRFYWTRRRRFYRRRYYGDSKMPEEVQDDEPQIEDDHRRVPGGPPGEE